jgi:hypothetical protein
MSWLEYVNSAFLLEIYGLCAVTDQYQHLLLVWQYEVLVHRVMRANATSIGEEKNALLRCMLDFGKSAFVDYA